MDKKNYNTFWHTMSVTRKMIEKKNAHKGVILWYTGLPSSGKSTLANAVNLELFKRGIHVFILDGDNIRQGLNKDLGFSPEERKENIRRIGEVARLFVEAGIIVSTAFVSPYASDRNDVRLMCAHGDFVEIFVRCPVEVCKKRDPKGLYKKAIKGEIADFTGISAPYEAPKKPEIIIDTSLVSLQKCANIIIRYLKMKAYIPTKK